jgi:hypothetical protein
MDISSGKAALSIGSGYQRRGGIGLRRSLASAMRGRRTTKCPIASFVMVFVRCGLRSNLARHHNKNPSHRAGHLLVFAERGGFEPPIPLPI